MTSVPESRQNVGFLKDDQYRHKADQHRHKDDQYHHKLRNKRKHLQNTEFDYLSALIFY